MYKSHRQMLGTNVRRILDRRQMIRHRDGLTAGMRLGHSFVPTVLCHALATFTLFRAHCHCGQSARHDRSGKQQQRQQRNADFANQLHNLTKV